MPDKNVADSLQRVPGVTHQFGRRERRRLRRERSRQHARHQSEPDADADQRSHGFVRRLVRAEPDRPGRPQRDLYVAAVRNRRRWSSCTRPRRRLTSKAASPATSTSRRASRSTSRKPLTGDVNARRRLRRPAGQDRSAVQRPGQLAERRQDVRRAGAVVLREARTCAATARRNSATSRSSRTARWPLAHPDLGQCLLSGPARLGVVHAEARAQGRHDRHAVQAERSR